MSTFSSFVLIQELYKKSSCPLKTYLVNVTKSTDSWIETFIFCAINHYVKSVHIRSFLWSVFSHIQTKYGHLLGKSQYSVQIRENPDQENSRILILFTQRTKYGTEKLWFNFVYFLDFNWPSKLQSWDLKAKNQGLVRKLKHVDKLELKNPLSEYSPRMVCFGPTLINIFTVVDLT